MARRLPPDARGASIRGDLREEYHDLRKRRGRWTADAWFVIEALRLSTRVSRSSRVESLLRDLRLGVRSLLRAPGFALLTVLTIALGLGANTTIFAVVRSVVLNPLPFANVDRVVAVRTGAVGQTTRSGAISFPLFLDFERETTVPEEWGGWRSWQAALTPTDGAPTLRINAAGATSSVFPILGLSATQGRLFTEDDELQGSAPVAVVSHAFWQGFLGSDPAAIGRTLRLNDTPFTIVGILPRSFRGETSGGGVLPPGDVEVWVPYRNSPVAEGIGFRGLQNVNGVALLPAERFDEAQAELDQLMVALGEEFEEHEGDIAQFVPAQDVVVREGRPTVLLLFGAATLVLALACLNATSLTLGRATVRTREMSVRRVLGASRARLAGLLLAEAAVLAAAGGTLAAALAFGGVRVLRALDPGTLPRLEDAGIDGPTVGFLMASVAAVALILCAVPMWRARRSSADFAVRGRDASTLGRPGRLRPILVAAQVAFATVLFASSLLLVRSLGRVLDVEPGFDATGLLTARVDHPTGFVSDQWREHVAFFESVVASVREIPGVEAAAAAYQDPADPGWNNSFSIVGQGDVLRGAIFRPVTPGYFEAAGITILSGRDFTASDDHDAPGVAIVNRAFASRYFPDGDALQQVVNYGDFWQARADPEYTIVGVVDNVRFTGLETEVPPAIYFPHPQQPVKEMALVVRTGDDPMHLVPQVRSVVAGVNPTLPVFAIDAVSDKLRSHYAGRRFVVWLLGAFAAVSLSLSAIGLYGVLAFLVSRRRREIGVRMAVGASASSVRSLVVREGLGLVLVGLLVGVPAALILARVMRSVLFEVSPGDATTLVVVVATVLATGLVACVAPAARATRVDPLEALRSE